MSYTHDVKKVKPYTFSAQWEKINCRYPCGYTSVKANTSKENNNSFLLQHKDVKSHYTVFSTTPIHQIWVSLTFGVFSTSVSHSLCFPLLCDRKKRCQWTGFFGELRAIMSAFAVTDEVGKSDGQLQSFLSPQACLALTLCAMFSEGTCHSAVAQTDRQMVHIATEHERDWQSSNQSLGGPS